MKSPQGVRKINENVLQEKRAFIITDEDKDNYSFADLPDGTTYIDTVTGNEYLKLKGQADWVPKNIKQDNTISIVKDSMVLEETYTIKSIDKTNQEFVYINDSNEQRTGKIDDQGHFIFRLDKGTFTPGRNHLTVSIDGVLLRTVESGTLVEVDDQQFYTIDTNLEIGHVIVVSYIQWIRIGNPYPRIFMTTEEPQDAEVGDLWIGVDTGEDGDDGSDETPSVTSLSWGNITNKPTTLSGYGIIDAASKYHTHKVVDITDFPDSLPANGGNANTVGGYSPGTSANNILVLDGSGKIPSTVFDSSSSVIPWTNVLSTPTTLSGYGITDAAAKTHTHKVADITDFPTTMKCEGGNADTVGGHSPGISAGNILVLDENGKVPTNNMPEISVFTKGMIIDWYGQSNMIPDGWHICDGTNGTPDLRNKFIIAAGDEYSLGDTGGETTHTLTIEELPAHTHTATVSTDGAHYHGTIGESTREGTPPWGFYDSNNNHFGSKGSMDNDNAYYKTSTEGDHTHTVTITSTGGGQSYNNMPPYIALFKIMKL